MANRALEDWTIALQYFNLGTGGTVISHQHLVIGTALDRKRVQHCQKRIYPVVSQDYKANLHCLMLSVATLAKA